MVMMDYVCLYGPCLHVVHHFRYTSFKELPNIILKTGCQLSFIIVSYSDITCLLKVYVLF